MIRSTRGCLIAAAIGFATLATASDPIIGIWHGTTRYDYSKLPSTLTAKQKTFVTSTYKKTSQSRITLTLSANHSYKIVISGISPTPPPTYGKWKQDSKSVTLQAVKENTPGAPVIFTLDKSGKSFSFSNGPLTMTFSR